MTTNIREHCNLCSGIKNHDILFTRKFKWSEQLSDDFTIDGSNTYTLIQCKGCDSVQFIHKSYFSEDYDQETGKPEITIKKYPPQTIRKEPRWLNDLIRSKIEPSIEGFIYEIYIALQNDSPRLAVLGIRALLEMVMVDKVGDQGSFGKNTTEFLNQGFISKKQKEVLDKILEIGHATMHRGYSPNIRELLRLVDITESIIETIYINEEKAKIISKDLPQRKKIPNKNQSREERI